MAGEPSHTPANAPQAIPHDTQRLTLRGVVGDVARHIIDLDYPWIRTLMALAIRPGHLARDYVDGRDRSRWTNPVKFCLAAAALSVAASHFFNLQATMTSSASAAGADPEFVRLVNAAIEWHFNWMHLVFLLTLPAIVIPLRLCFAHTKLNLAEHTVFVMYTFGFSFLAWILLLPFNPALHSWLSFIYMLLSIIYLCWAGCQFYGGRWYVTASLIIIADFVYYLSYAVLACITAFTYVLIMRQ